MIDKIYVANIGLRILFKKKLLDSFGLLVEINL